MKVLKENEIAVDRTVMKEICNTVRELSGYADSIKPSEISKIIKNHMELDNSDKEKLDTLCSDLENTKSKLEDILSKLTLDENYVHTDNNFTNDDKEKLNNLHNTELQEHLVTDENYVHTDNNFTDRHKEKLDAIEFVIQDEEYVHTDNNYSDEDKSIVDSIDSRFNTLEGKIKTNYENLKTYLESVNKILNEDKYKDDIEKIYSKLEELESEIKNSNSVDKSIVHSGYYNSANRTIVIVLSNGDKIEIPAGSLVDIYDGDNETIKMNKRTNTFSLTDNILEKINGKEGN